MVGRSTSSHTHFTMNGQPQFIHLGELALAPCIWHSAARGSKMKFFFCKSGAILWVLEKKNPTYIKYVFKKYTFKSKKMQVYQICKHHYTPITQNEVEMCKTQKNLSKCLYSQLFVAVFYPSLCHQVSNSLLKVIDALTHFFQ